MVIKVTGAVARARLADVPQEKRFWCSDGRNFKNLSELAAAFQQMKNETFRYHANEKKNDFSKWVQDVIGDDKLAIDLQKSVNAGQAAKAVADRVIWLKQKVATG